MLGEISSRGSSSTGLNRACSLPSFSRTIKMPLSGPYSPINPRQRARGGDGLEGERPCAMAIADNARISRRATSFCLLRVIDAIPSPKWEKDIRSPPLIQCARIDLQRSLNRLRPTDKYYRVKLNRSAGDCYPRH